MVYTVIIPIFDLATTLSPLYVNKMGKTHVALTITMTIEGSGFIWPM